MGKITEKSTKAQIMDAYTQALAELEKLKAMSDSPVENAKKEALEASMQNAEVAASNEVFSDTIVKLYEVLKDRGFPYGMDDHYPTAARACMACRPDSAVIDCNGNIFKCRTQTGELDKKIGNVLNLENQTRKKQYRK